MKLRMYLHLADDLVLDAHLLEDGLDHHVRLRNKKNEEGWV